mgnify:CR=1 FL=1
MMANIAASSQLLWAQTEQTYHQFTRLQSLSEGWHWLLLVGICSLIMTFVILMYRRDCVELPRGTSLALMFLRSVAYFGILFFFLNLEKLTEQTLTKNSRAMVLIDTSQSMGLRDGQTADNPTNSSRLDLVAEELAPAVDALSDVLGLATCFHDPAVGVYGLENALLPVGTNFLEVVHREHPLRLLCALF